MTSDEVSGYAFDWVGNFLRLNARYDGAEPLFRSVLTIREKVLGPEHPDTAASRNNLISCVDNLARLLDNRGDYDKAEEAYKRLIKIREEVLGPEAWEVASSLTNLSVLYRNQGRYDKAEHLNERALKVYAKALGPDHPTAANTGTNLALLKFLMGKNNEAVDLCKRFLDAHRENQERDGLHPDQLRKLAKCYHGLAHYGDFPARNWKDAEKHYELAIDYFDQLKDQTGRAKSELDLQEMFRMSRQEVDDARVREIQQG